MSIVPNRLSSVFQVSRNLPFSKQAPVIDAQAWIVGMYTDTGERFLSIIARILVDI
jgi:hypothetical protein